MNVGVIIYCFVQKAHVIGKQNVYVCLLHVLGLEVVTLCGRVHAVVSVYSPWNHWGDINRVFKIN